ncbi:hypothetical protein, partial [Streptomyces kaempferi]
MAVVNAVGKAFHPDAELRDNEAERGLFPDGISRRGLARPEQVPEIALDDIHPDENFYSTSDQELQAPKHSRAIDDVPAIDDWTELGDASTATTAEALPQSQPELNHPQINDTTSVANTALIHTPDSADTGNISLHASSNVFLDAPRTPLTTGMETASNHPSPTRQRRYTEATLQPIMRPLTREALRMAAKQVGDMVGVRQGLENCVDLTDAMLRRLFPGGVRAAAGVWDDSAVGANRAEGRLVPGGTWSRLTSLDQVTQALTENGSTAVVLEQGEQGKGHVNLYVNIGSHSDAPEHAQIVRVDLQATLQDRLAVEELPRDWRHFDSGWREVRAGRGTRVIVIGPTGQAQEPASVPTRSESSSASQALLDGLTGHGYGALGWEVEVHDQVITTTDRKSLEYGTELALHASGMKLVVDDGVVYRAGGVDFPTLDAAKSSGRGNPKSIGTSIIEVVSPPYSVLRGGASKWANLETGKKIYFSFRAQMRNIDRVTALKDLLSRRDGWEITSAGSGVAVHPTLGGPRRADNNVDWPQITLGVNMSGASVVLAAIQDRGVARTMPSVASAREFASDIAVAFAADRLQMAVTSRQLPYLFAAVPDLTQLDAYAWLMFTHASADFLGREFGGARMLVKSMLSAALRNPFHEVRGSLSHNSRDFLKRNARYIVERFNYHLQRTADTLAQANKRETRPFDFLAHTSFHGVTVGTYLESMITGTPHVTQYDAVGMEDYPLDNANNWNLALLELRNLFPAGANDVTFQRAIVEFSEIANNAHSLVSRFQNWDHARTREIAAHVINHPLVQGSQSVLDRLTGPPVSFFSQIDRLSISYDIADSVIARRPLGPQSVHVLQSAHGKLTHALSGSQFPARLRSEYTEVAQRLGNLLRGLSAAGAGRATAGHVVPRGPVVDGYVEGGGLSLGRSDVAPVSAVDSASEVASGRGGAEGSSTLEISASLTGPGSVLPGRGVVAVVGWGVVRAGAVVRRAEGVWMDPVSRPVG